MIVSILIVTFEIQFISQYNTIPLSHPLIPPLYTPLSKNLSTDFTQIEFTDNNPFLIPSNENKKTVCKSLLNNQNNSVQSNELSPYRIELHDWSNPIGRILKGCTYCRGSFIRKLTPHQHGNVHPLSIDDPQRSQRNYHTPIRSASRTAQPDLSLIFRICYYCRSHARLFFEFIIMHIQQRVGVHTRAV